MSSLRGTSEKVNKGVRRRLVGLRDEFPSRFFRVFFVVSKSVTDQPFEGSRPDVDFKKNYW